MSGSEEEEVLVKEEEEAGRDGSEEGRDDPKVLVRGDSEMVREDDGREPKREFMRARPTETSVSSP